MWSSEPDHTCGVYCKLYVNHSDLNTVIAIMACASFSFAFNGTGIVLILLKGKGNIHG
jgi:hypothetical protein